MQLALQSTIGTDSRNLHYCVLKDKEKNELYMYFGNALIEKASGIKDGPQLKHFLGRLYNANVKAKNLTDHFGCNL